MYIYGLFGVYKLVLMDPSIVDYSVEISARCSFVIEFIIPKFLKAPTQPWQWPVTTWAYKPEAANTV
jgi:hypothetical protein